MKVLNGSPVLLRGGDGRKAHLVDMVLTPGDMILNPSLIAICFIKFDDGTGWWHGPSYMLAPDTDGLFLNFEQHEHLRRLMTNLPVDVNKPVILEGAPIDFIEAEFEIIGELKEIVQ